MTDLDPVNSIANLTYIAYPGDLISAFHVTQRRKQDRKCQQSQRNVFQCFVFGPKNAGKSALLNALIGSSDESSWKRATELLVEVATHGEVTGYDIPCLIVAAKDDLDPYPLAISDSTRVSQDMGIEAPITVSMRLGDVNNLFRRIINAVQHPHLSIP
ncbi:hypothetical protein AMTR_s00003p00022810 [Amborella trichopoda]|uniref:G domain-containing protein n=1 Tax=Amborella trichopoda TaxID=13333 RepID=W1P650_AMBTC|nr:hypothetical protein AMTR_s00003p00022810 [Amborella trichopoda]